MKTINIKHAVAIVIAVGVLLLIVFVLPGSGLGSGEPNVNINATPTEILAGEDVDIGWDVSNATSCTAFSPPQALWTGSKDPDGGLETVSGITSNTAFVLDCTGPGGNGEAGILVTVRQPQCNDGDDNDSDTLTDFPSDPGCTDADDDDETDPAGVQCGDGIDNDGDGKVDGDDLRCASPLDTSEYPADINFGNI